MPKFSRRRVHRRAGAYGAAMGAAAAGMRSLKTYWRSSKRGGKKFSSARGRLASSRARLLSTRGRTTGSKAVTTNSTGQKRDFAGAPGTVSRYTEKHRSPKGYGRMVTKLSQPRWDTRNFSAQVTWTSPNQVFRILSVTFG